jgi:carbamoylphosphate synthase large subunit
VASRVLITGAGTGASNNFIRSLRAGEPSLVIVGCSSDRFFLKKSTADRNYLIARTTHPSILNSLRRVINAERIDLVIPNSDTDVKVVASLRDQLPCRVFLPRNDVVDLCQDKCELAGFLRARGVPAPLTYPVTHLDHVEDLFRQLGPRSRLWCRIRNGAGSMGAMPVRTPAQARGWMSYWEEMRGVSATAFTLSEYLPGRDFACQSLWKDGKLVLIKTTQRLAYLGAGNTPSGMSSVGTIHKTIHEPRLAEVSIAAVRVLDSKISGAFSIDLKEDADGTPCITEINVGRLLSGTTIFDLTGKHNMAVTYVKLALDQTTMIAEPYDVVDGYYMVRDLDTTPDIFHADELLEGIQDARL